MGTGYDGTFVISWSQTETDGIAAASPRAIVPGSLWRWGGQAVRVDRPAGALYLEAPEGAAELRARAARMVRWLVGASLGRAYDRPRPDPDQMAPEDAAPGFTLTDGRRTYVATPIDVPETGARLVMFAGHMPPAGRDLWIVAASLDRQAGAGPAPATPGGLVCFTPDARIATPAGPVPAGLLRAGDRVQTRDDGVQEILWCGQRRMSGARLHALPALRPIRFRGAAPGQAQPEADLLVSPCHRVLVRGAAAQALFGQPEVLVAARDLVDGGAVTVDLRLREVTYVHLLLERHQILFANGVECDSFHPAHADPAQIDPHQALALRAILPDLAEDGAGYGPAARRLLTGPEAAILRHDLAAAAPRQFRG